MTKHLTLLSCCLNEAKNIPTLYQQLESVLSRVENISWHLLIVDDGSTDDTPLVIEQLISKGCHIEYLQLSRNFGKEAAITAGLDHVCHDGVILIDADLQHPVSPIKDMILLWQQGADMVIAVPNVRATSLLNRFSSWLYHRLISISNKIPVTTHGGDFRLIDQALVKHLRKLRERTRYMKGLYGFAGGNIKTVTYNEQDRFHGQSQFSFHQRLSLALNGLISFTTFPLRFFTLAGIFVLLLATLYLIYILFEIMIFGRSVPGFASLLFIFTLLNGLIMLQIGVQGEYIAKILEEVKQRPIYLIKNHQSYPMNKTTDHE